MHTAQEEIAVIVTGRHLAVTEPIKEYAHKKIEHLGLEFPRVIEARFILDVDRHHSHRHIAELILHCANHITIEAKEESDDLYASIDGVIDKARRRMAKAKAKIQRHKPRRAKSFEVDLQVLKPGGEDEEERSDEPKVVLTEKFAIKPMFVDEAVMQLEVSHDQFLVFLNAESEKVNVLYRRKSGNYGLIQPTL